MVHFKEGDCDFSPTHWVYGENITVKQFCDYLQQRIPEDAIFYVCGDSQVYMHLEEDGSVSSVDDCSLSDMEEYEDYEVRELEEIQSGY